MPDAVRAASPLAATDEERCLALPARHWSDDLMDALEEMNRRAAADLEKLRALHAQILGCTVEELDTRLAAEKAQEDARRAEARTQRPARAPRTRRAAPSSDPARIGMAQLTERQRELLAHVRVEGNVAVYVPEERIADWAALKVVMVALGGTWRSRKAGRGGFVFPDDIDAQERVRLAIATGEVLDPRRADFFATPAPLADRVVALAEIQPGDVVLEPSAGRGAIALAVRRACPGANVICIEALPDHRAELERLGFRVIGEEFLAHRSGPFDAIVMNPPFSKRADIVHVEHALGLLASGGALVSIMSAGVVYRDDQLARDFRARVESLGGRFEENPDGSFLESGTGVRTVTLVIPRRTR